MENAPKNTTSVTMTPSTRTLYFFRHGLTDWNQQRRLQGHTNIPLNAEGRQQAQQLRQFFGAHPVEYVFSSDLDRAVETAALATGTPPEHIVRLPGLREAHLGESEGLHEDDIIARFGQSALDNWRSMAPEHLHFSLPGGESRDACNRRFHQALVEIFNNYSFNVAAICSHGFVLRRAFHFLTEELRIPPMIQNCVIFKASYDEATQKFEFEF